jgi:hypothetical protein
VQYIDGKGTRKGKYLFKDFDREGSEEEGKEEGHSDGSGVQSNCQVRDGWGRQLMGLDESKRAAQRMVSKQVTQELELQGTACTMLACNVQHGAYCMMQHSQEDSCILMSRPHLCMRMHESSWE